MSLVDSNSYNWKREPDRNLLRGMLMTTCDLAAITKPWEMEQRVSLIKANFSKDMPRLDWICFYRLQNLLQVNFSNKETLRERN
jgi:hypothetical protein